LPAALATTAEEPALTLRSVPMVTVASMATGWGQAVASRTDRLPRCLGE
jgi:hypothetical protein